MDKEKHLKRQQAKEAILQKAETLKNHLGILVKVKYHTLEEHGLLDAWLIQRGMTEPDGDCDYVTIDQAISLGLIKTDVES